MVFTLGVLAGVPTLEMGVAALAEKEDPRGGQCNQEEDLGDVAGRLLEAVAVR
jgi:hypothetical protein